MKSKILDAISDEYKNISHLEESEQELRFNLLDNIRREVYRYEWHIQQFNFLELLNSFKKRGLEFELFENSNEIKELWENTFTKNLTTEQKEKIYFSQYRWHIFSYKVFSALSDKQANKAFSDATKDEVYLFYQDSNKYYKIKNAHLFLLDDLLNETFLDFNHEFFIFDAKQKWTYIHTHEQQCGPYFYQID